MSFKWMAGESSTSSCSIELSPARIGGKQGAGEWRIFFGLGYQDLRDGVLKGDNRPTPVRTADTAHSKIGTAGGHHIYTV
jgi:hypothetical protein